MVPFFRVTDWEKSSLWRRITFSFLRVLILLVFLSALIKFLGPPIGISLVTWQEGRKFPGLKVTPQPLSDMSVSNAPGTTLSYFGYSFDVPWNTAHKQGAFGERGFVQIKFSSGQSVTLIAPEDQDGLLTQILQDQSLHLENTQTAFGDLMKRSPFEQYRTLLNTTPEGIRAFGPREAASRGTILLTIKAIAIPSPGLEKGIFSFEFSDKRGFQIGDPQESRRVLLELFDIGGRHVEIICETNEDSPRLSQPQLNRILKSIHTVPIDSSEEPAIDQAK